MGSIEERKSIGKKTLIYLAGNFSSKIFSMIIIPIYAKYLTASELGSFDFQQTMGNLLMPIMALAIWEAVLRFGLTSSEKKTNEVITTAVVIASISIAISSLIILVTYINVYGLTTHTILYVVLITTMPIVTVLGYISRAVKKNKIYASSGIISAFFNMFFIIIFVVINNYGVTGLLISSVGANIFNIIYLVIGTKLVDRLKWKNFLMSEAKILIAYSAPLILNLTFGWFLNSFSRFYINLALGVSFSGIYAFGSKFSGIFLQISSILNMSVIEDAVESINSVDWTKRFENNIANISKILFELSTLIMIVTSIYYDFVGNKEFQQSLFLVPYLLLSGVFTSYSILIGNIFPVYKETKKIFITTMIGGISNVVLVMILSSEYGLFGIAIAQVASSLILVVCRYIFAQKLSNFYVDKQKFILRTMYFVLLSFLVIKSVFLFKIFILFCFILYLFIGYRKNIFDLITKLKN